MVLFVKYIILHLCLKWFNPLGITDGQQWQCSRCETTNRLIAHKHCNVDRACDGIFFKFMDLVIVVLPEISFQRPWSCNPNRSPLCKFLLNLNFKNPCLANCLKWSTQSQPKSTWINLMLQAQFRYRETLRSSRIDTLHNNLFYHIY